MSRPPAPVWVTLPLGGSAALVATGAISLAQQLGWTAGWAAVALLAVSVIATTSTAAVLPGLAVGAMSWLMLDGFVESRAGDLGWHPGDAIRLAVLVAVGAAAPAARALLDASGRAAPEVTPTRGWLLPRPELRSHTGGVRRGQLRIYLGAAPGVGKSYAMLTEGHRRRERGTDVVVGAVDTRGRHETEALLDGLEVMPGAARSAAGDGTGQLDVDAVLARHPQVALVDDLGQSNPPGSRNSYRWQDVEALLAAGIEVISTVNINQLESLRDVVAAVTGLAPVDCVPDAIVRGADQVQLVDMTAEALRRRIAHGNIYGPDEVNAALASTFRIGTLNALRELALVWLADNIETALHSYRAQHDIDAAWETRERIVVALRGGPEGTALIRRAARLAARTGSELLAVHVARSGELADNDVRALATQRSLVESLAGSYHQIVGDDVGAALIEFARSAQATQLVLGASRASRLRAFLTGGGVAAATLRRAGPIDVHIVTPEQPSADRMLPSLRQGLPPKRRTAGLVTAALLLPAMTAAMANLRDGLNLPSEMLLYLVAVVGVALVGGLYPALVSAVAGSLLLNWFFTPPFHTFTIEERNNALALVVFVVVAAAVSSVVDLAARRTNQAARAAAEADTLSALAGSVLRGDSALPALLERLRETFGMSSVTLLERTDGGSPTWTVIESSGPPVTTPEQADADVPASERLVLALRGHPLSAADLRVVSAFAAQTALALEQRRLAQAAQAAQPIAEADRVRAALLTAVSHDLRTPLASAMAAVSSLRSNEVAWTEQETAELLATAEESLERLARLVANLLDMSRLQAGVLSVFPRPVALEDVVPAALDSLGPAGQSITVDVPDTLPPVVADPALLERVIANLAGNAIRYAPKDKPPHVTASALSDRVELRVADRGPGIPVAAREDVFAPFQRLGDTDNTVGVGLGLALARGLTEAMGGTVVPEDTPGGGLTMVVSLAAATPTLTTPRTPRDGRSGVDVR